VSAYAAWHQIVPICTEWWCTEANEATQTHWYNPVAPAYPIWAYYAHGRQRRCQEDPVSLPFGRLEKTTRSFPASRDSAPSNGIWNNITLRSQKQPIWLRTALCEGWCRRMALRNRELHARNDDDEVHCWNLLSMISPVQWLLLLLLLNKKIMSGISLRTNC